MNSLEAVVKYRLVVAAVAEVGPILAFLVTVVRVVALCNRRGVVVHLLNLYVAHMKRART